MFGKMRRSFMCHHFLLHLNAARVSDVASVDIATHSIDSLSLSFDIQFDSQLSLAAS
jgi:hypothetical protein